MNCTVKKRRVPMGRVDINGFADAVQDILNEYGDKAFDVMQEVLPKVAKDTVKELKNTSPKDKGNYAKSWATKTSKTRVGCECVVYNKEYYLTHLLENGHKKVRGGSVPGQKHIAPAADNAERNAIEMLKEKLS